MLPARLSIAEHLIPSGRRTFWPIWKLRLMVRVAQLKRRGLDCGRFEMMPWLWCAATLAATILVVLGERRKAGRWNDPAVALACADAMARSAGMTW
jgi:hypothetical protein